VHSALAALACLIPAAALAQARPELTNTRIDEDWSVLAEQPRQGLDAVKYIPLGQSSFLTTGAELRVRSEAYRNNLWGDTSAPDDAYVLFRAMPYIDVHAGRLRAFAQPIAGYAKSVTPSPSPIDQTRVDLLQAFGEVELPLGDASVAVRGGRQMLSLGTERLIGTRYGANLPLAFDGVRATVGRGKGNLSLFLARPVRPGPDNFDDAASPAKLVWGAYATHAGLDLYYLGYRNRAATFAAGSGRETRHSVGLRSFGTSNGWHWNVEGVLQFGHFAGGSIFAWTLGSEFGHRFSGAQLSPDVTVRFDVISGDTDADDGRLGTFNAFFPKAKYFGELSPLGPYNLVNLNPRVSFDIRLGLTLDISGQAYWRYARADGIYDIPGNLMRSLDGATSKMIGKQIEAVLDWQATRTLGVTASMSLFEPGGFIRQTGPARAITMLGLETTYKF
jgi:hypothetical protein